MSIGSHIEYDTNLSLLNNIKHIHNIGGNIIQFFVNVLHHKTFYDDTREYIKTNNIKCIVHASCIINCGLNWDKYSWWIYQFINEIILGEYVGAEYIVVHTGKKLRLTIEECMNNLYTSLLYVHEKTKKFKIKILLETSSGQGSELFSDLESFAKIYNKLSTHVHASYRFGICIDTCHIFAAGYNIQTKKQQKTYLKLFDTYIGLNNVKLIHLNNSKHNFHSMVDRHETIGKGYIAKKALINLAKIFNSMNVDIVLETPSNNICNDLMFVLQNVF